ncbi:SOUL heme-binding protein, partial [bacterium]|nr:SOUL heme-binding protein [bacterium]
PYTVIKQEGKIEIREYQRVVSAEVTMMGDRGEAASDAFRILVRFIQGQNTTQTSIAMTAPVSQIRDDDQGWHVSFFMPNHMNLDEVPNPVDSRIRIKELTDTHYAAIRFSGFSSRHNLAKHEVKLRDYLIKHEYDFVDKPTYAFYNPPYIPPFFRRNEVLFELKN